jgi:hypothetical protein
MGKLHAYRELREIPGVTKEIRFKQKEMADAAKAFDLIPDQEMAVMAERGLCAAYTMIWISFRLNGDDVLAKAAEKLTGEQRDKLGYAPGFMKRSRPENADADQAAGKTVKDEFQNRELGTHTGLVPLALGLQKEYRNAKGPGGNHKDWLSRIADPLGLEMGQEFDEVPSSLGPERGNAVFAGYSIESGRHCFGIIRFDKQLLFFDSEVGEYRFEEPAWDQVLKAYVEALKKHFKFNPEASRLVAWHVKKKATQVSMPPSKIA